MLKLYFLFLLCNSIYSAIHYEIQFSFDEKLASWRKQLAVHDTMPATYVRFLAFKKLIKDFNPIQDEMLQVKLKWKGGFGRYEIDKKASLEAETVNDQGIKEMIIKMSTEANKEIEKRLLIHKPFLAAINKAVYKP